MSDLWKLDGAAALEESEEPKSGSNRGEMRHSPPIHTASPSSTNTDGNSY